MSRKLTNIESEDINRPGSPYNILAEHMRYMSDKERRKQFWIDYHRKILKYCICIIVFFCVFGYIYNPVPDVTVVWVTSTFVPNKSLEKSASTIFNSEIQKTYPNTRMAIRVIAVYNAPTGQQNKKLKSLLAKGGNIIFISDKANAEWLYENGFTTTSDGNKLSVSYSALIYLGQLDENNSCATLLSNFNAALSKAPVATGNVKKDANNKAKYNEEKLVFTAMTGFKLPKDDITTADGKLTEMAPN